MGKLSTAIQVFWEKWKNKKDFNNCSESERNELRVLSGNLKDEIRKSLKGRLASERKFTVRKNIEKLWQSGWQDGPWFWIWYNDGITGTTKEGVYPIIVFPKTNNVQNPTIQMSISYGDDEVISLFKQIAPTEKIPSRFHKDKENPAWNVFWTSIYKAINPRARTYFNMEPNGDWGIIDDDRKASFFGKIIPFNIDKADFEEQFINGIVTLINEYEKVISKGDVFKEEWKNLELSAIKNSELPITPISTNTQISQAGHRHLQLVQEIKELLVRKKQVILSGAPGTGKTFLAKEVAASMIFPDLARKDMKKALEKLQVVAQVDKANRGAGTGESQYSFIQFHPGYDYSDFVEGLKPKVTESGDTWFERVDGVFMDFCKKAQKAMDDDLDLTDVEYITPQLPGLYKAPDIEKPYVMVIDEINRADLSRVFGELFYGLEKDYRGEPFQTQYSYLSGEDFVIPPNVYIIGTMNDIDRSVESMDFALRRRFAWREIAVKDSECILDTIIFPGLRERTIEVMGKVNEEVIEKMLGLDSAFHLGAAYYRDIEYYANEDDDAEDCSEWETLWKYSLSVILNEYLHTSRRKYALEDLHRKYLEIHNSVDKLKLPADSQLITGCSWIISPGENASQWPLFQKESIIAMNFEPGIGDISNLANIDDLKAKMYDAAPEHYSKPQALRSNGFMLWHFAHSLVPGTVIYARKGIKPGIATILGRGVVTGRYSYNAAREQYRHEVKVKWTWIGNKVYTEAQLARQTLAPVDHGPKLDTLESMCRTGE